MTSLQLVTWIQGALAALCLVVALIFVRTWRRARDRFYLFFAIAFGVLMVHWVALGARGAGEHSPYPYLTRLAAFLLILFAIVDKNHRAARE